MRKSPIFISGIGRSGTSAVISSLAEHKQVIRPDRIGEAPIVNHFLTFLCEYEDRSPEREYHLKNYQLDAPARADLYSSLISSLQYGRDVSQSPDEELFWVAKVSLSKDKFEKALEVFGDLRIIYVIRNGVEMVNSARHFPGFANLTFEQLCKRWSDSIFALRYLMSQDNCAVIRHDELVNDPYAVYEDVFSRLNMEADSAPAQFIDSTLFNSSFDPTSRMKSVDKVFNNRLDCWSQWSASEQKTFISCCDEYMQALEFQRPYETNSNVALSGPNEKVDCADTQSDARKEHSGAEINDKTAGSQHSKNDEHHDKPADVEEGVQVSPPGTNFALLETVASGAVSPAMLDYHCHVSRRYGYLYVENSMVASSNILPVLQKEEDSELASRMEHLFARDQSPLSRLSGLEPDQQRYFLKDSNSYRFAFVRNPLERLLAAWLLKIDSGLQPKAEILAVVNAVSLAEIEDLSQSVNFPTFLDVVCSMEPSSLSPHWNHQTRQLLMSSIEYNKIGRYESFTDDFTAICKKLFDNKIPEISVTDVAKVTTAQLYEFYDEALVKKVYQAFYDDFNAFDYPANLPDMARSA